MEFCWPGEQLSKSQNKNNEMKHKHLDLAGEQRKLWNMKVTGIQVVLMWLNNKRGWKSWKLEDERGSSKLYYYWNCPKYEKSLGHLRRLEETCCHSESTERPSANAGVTNLQWIIMIMIIIHSYEQLVYVQPSIYPRKSLTQTQWDFDI